MTEEPRYGEANHRERERLRGLVRRLGPDELRTHVSDAWTVADVFGHLAFWDSRNLVLGKKLEHGLPFTPSDDEPDNVDWINDAMHPLIHAIETMEAARVALRLAEETDQLMISLDPSRLWPVDPNSKVNPLRASHRAEHLDQIEAALRGRIS